MRMLQRCYQVLNVNQLAQSRTAKGLRKFLEMKSGENSRKHEISREKQVVVSSRNYQSLAAVDKKWL